MKATQQDQLLTLLRRGKVNSWEATYQLAMKQAPTRINELKEQGYVIVSNKAGHHRSVDWELITEPKREPQPVSYRFEGNTAIPVYEHSISERGSSNPPSFKDSAILHATDRPTDVNAVNLTLF